MVCCILCDFVDAFPLEEAEREVDFLRHRCHIESVAKNFARHVREQQLPLTPSDLCCIQLGESFAGAINAYKRCIAGALLCWISPILCCKECVPGEFLCCILTVVASAYYANVGICAIPSCTVQSCLACVYGKVLCCNNGHGEGRSIVVENGYAVIRNVATDMGQHKNVNEAIQVVEDAGNINNDDGNQHPMDDNAGAEGALQQIAEEVNNIAEGIETTI